MTAFPKADVLLAVAGVVLFLIPGPSLHLRGFVLTGMPGHTNVYGDFAQNAPLVLILKNLLR